MPKKQRHHHQAPLQPHIQPTKKINTTEQLANLQKEPCSSSRPPNQRNRRRTKSSTSDSAIKNVTSTIYFIAKFILVSCYNKCFALRWKLIRSWIVDFVIALFWIRVEVISIWLMWILRIIHGYCIQFVKY